VKDCGVWIRLTKEGKLDNTVRRPMNLGAIKEELHWFLGQMGSLSYCAPGPLFFKIMAKELEQENARLKRLVADLSLDNAILKEASRGNS